MKHRICSKCKSSLPISKFYRRGRNGLQGLCKLCSKANWSEYGEKWRKLYPEKKRLLVRNSWNKLRLKVFEALGHKCKRCGFTDKRALQVDHPNGGGNAEARRLDRAGNGGGWRLMKLVIANPLKYRILCANCNVITHAERLAARNNSNPCVIWRRPGIGADRNKT